MSDSPSLKRTALYDRHVALGAKMVPFAGYDMPVQYSGIINEHMAVRERAGLFDVSHMGEVFITGETALDFVQNLVSNDASTLVDGKALYTVMCKPDGGIVDDLLVYRLAENEYLLVINASNIEGDVAWMRANNPMGATIDDQSEQISLLALQGPASFEILKSATGYDASALSFYHFDAVADGSLLGMNDVIVSRTGYTGEVGVEIYIRNEDAVTLWDALLTAGEAHGLIPTGLGARDTLRLESGYCLYGNDISEDTNPIEAGLGWITKLQKDAFNGRDVIAGIKEAGPQRKLVGFIMDEKGIPRQGYPLTDPDGNEIGIVTSGTQSPILGKGIGMGYVPNDPAFTAPGSKVHVQARNRNLAATVSKPPFHKS